MRATAEQVGACVLANLDAGRAVAHANQRAESGRLELAVRRELDIDLMRGKPARGLAGRIARRLRGHVSVSVRGQHRDWITVRGVQKILARLSYRSDSLRSNGHTYQNGDAAGE